MRISPLPQNDRLSIKAHAAGMTLIEIMVTMAVVAMILGITISQIGGTFDSHARQATRELSATVRYLYNKAASENLTMRIVFDLEKQSYWVEATTDKFLLESDEAREERLKDQQRASESTGGDDKKPPVQEAEAHFGEVDSHLLKATQLPGGVFFKDIQTEHDPRPVSGGKAYIHIFPSGYVERSIVNFRDEEDREQRALEINPMTGASRVYEEYRELKK